MLRATPNTDSESSVGEPSGDQSTGLESMASPGTGLTQGQVLNSDWWKEYEAEASRSSMQGSAADLQYIDMDTVAAVVLGGGAGDGLFPLTQVQKHAAPCALTARGFASSYLS